MSLYPVIITESFISTLWPLKMEVTAEAMRLFGGYDMALAAACSTAGVLLSVLALWGMGRVLRQGLRQQKHVRYTAEKAENRAFFRGPLGIGLMLLVWMPMGFAVAISAGFLRVPLLQLLSLAALGCSAYYASTLMWL